jgi:hypothetical protein
LKRSTLKTAIDADRLVLLRPRPGATVSRPSAHKINLRERFERQP